MIKVDIERYNPLYKAIWDDFVTNSKNGTFLICRDYMEYHADRFTDHSLLFFIKQELIAILPANIKDESSIISHEGLTYGGLILSTYAKATHVLAIIETLKNYLYLNGISELIYKKTPYIYHRYPSDEDLYALFKHGAELISRSISSCICPDSKIEYSELRRRCINKSEKFNLQIENSREFSRFWNILEANLATKYNTSPTHTLSEIEYLSNRFPANIMLYEILKKNSILGGCILYKTPKTAHIQYISSTGEGRKSGVLDRLFKHIIAECYNSGLTLDFGTSTEKNGAILNESLISQKEGFGARAITYDTYKLTIN